uniref:Uncharacterized protein n=1 Tax=Anguilla anguilla TaxID=7936 RepID=A0A0E9X131_ANGAN
MFLKMSVISHYIYRWCSFKCESQKTCAQAKILSAVKKSILEFQQLFYPIMNRKPKKKKKGQLRQYQQVNLTLNDMFKYEMYKSL